MPGTDADAEVDGTSEVLLDTYDEPSPAEVPLDSLEVNADAPGELDAPLDAPDVPGEGEFGAPCTGNEDCYSGWCVEGPDGASCTRECDEACPSGFDCKTVITAAADPASLCVPTFTKLCQACTVDFQCPYGRCMEIGGQRRCSIPCPEDGCGEGYECAADAGGDDGIDGWCVPTSGFCDCLVEHDGTARPCARANDFGSCTGAETCDIDSGWSECSAAEPAVEICDGIDNDCNSVTDDVDGQGDECELDNGFGSCPGNLDCVAGFSALQCLGKPAEAESCNYVDDDCDGDTDEGFDDIFTPCAAGQGICRRFGIYECAEDGSGAVCNAEAASPGAEACNGLDDDCDGEVDETFAEKGAVCTVGVGACARTGTLRCDGEGGGLVCSVAPGAEAAESCNALDDDCDGEVDEDFAELGLVCTEGVGVCQRAGVVVCTEEGSGTICSAEAGAAKSELCNGLDDDCDGERDEDFAGLGDVCTEGVGACERPGVLVCTDDGEGVACSALTGEPAVELCNGLDDDCDGEVDEEFAALGTVCSVGDGACRRSGVFHCTADGQAAECSAEAAAPTGELCNGVDDDCDGGIDEDFAGLGEVCTEGIGACERAGIRLCTDDGSGLECSVEPGDADFEACNGVDDDCDGEVDEDFEGLGEICVRGEGICLRAGVMRCMEGGIGMACSVEAGEPDAEACNGFDDDCDGETDEGFSGLGDVCVRGQGVCERAGVLRCMADGSDTLCSAAAGPPGAESCNGLDDDCDGQADEDFDGLGDVCVEGLGVCERSGVIRCAADGSVAECSVAAGTPTGELCNALDDDCDGLVDEDFDGLGDVCTVGEGVCERSGVIRCAADGSAAVCSVSAGDPGAELCNALDDDCDGLVDEDFGDVGEICVRGQGACERSGIMRCAADGSASECSVTAGSPAPELCNGVDDDCDGEVDEGFDGLGDVCTVGDGACERSGVIRCAADGSAAECSVSAGAPVAELCNGVDDDCDGTADEDFAGLGDVCTAGQGICLRSGIVQCAGDGSAGVCSATAGDPGVETCNGLDDDCDGGVDDNLASPLCPLQDGVCNGAAQVCAGAIGWLPCNAGSYGADYEVSEVSCDTLDNDCDGTADNVDADGDGARPEACGGDDCDDANPLAYTGASEICGDGVDNDCNGTPEDRDADDDGFVATACGGTDCNDSTAAARPDGSEVCGDGLDNDCDGSIDNKDADGDNFIDSACGGPDCDDGDLDVYPGAREKCDGKDTDCDGNTEDKDLDADGHVDADCTAYSGGLPADDCDDTDGDISPDASEICGNVVDEDCSGAVDDKDNDGDGHVDEACTSYGGADPIDDCDDDDADIEPAHAEVRDTKDNDCNGLPDEGLIDVGAIIVTEIIPNPEAVADELGEWFEVYNVQTYPVNMHGWVANDDGGESITVNAPDGLIVQPGESVVLCADGEIASNGGVACDYDYPYGTTAGTLAFGNSGDELNLLLDGVLIDRVTYTKSADNKSRSLSRDRYDHLLNDTTTSPTWCDGAFPYNAIDLGTPGVKNPNCDNAPAIVSITESSGVDEGGETVIISGFGFNGFDSVTFDGVDNASCTALDDTTITCTTDAHAPGVVDVTVIEGADSDTLTGGYTYVGDVAAGGAAVDWCNIQYPQSTSTYEGVPTEVLFSRVYDDPATTAPGPPAGIVAQLGYGPQGSDPRSAAGWLFVDATWNNIDYSPDDELMGTLTVPTAGTYSYVFRYSTDGGITFVHCDWSTGTSDGFDTGNVGTLTVN